MSPDKVMRPKGVTRAAAGIKQAKSGIIEGPTAKGSSDTLTPFRREKAGK